MINEFTADQIADAISKALREHEVTVIPGLIKLLALKDPTRAQAIYDTIQLGIAISRYDDHKKGDSRG